MLLDIDVPAVPVVNGKATRQALVPRLKGKHARSTEDLMHDQLVALHVVQEIVHVFRRDNREFGPGIEMLWHGLIVLSATGLTLGIKMLRPNIRRVTWSTKGHPGCEKPRKIAGMQCLA